MIRIVRNDGMRREGDTVKDASKDFYNLYNDMCRSYEVRNKIDRCENGHLKSFVYHQTYYNFTFTITRV